MRSLAGLLAARMSSRDAAGSSVSVDVVQLRGDHLIVLSRPDDIIVARVDETERRRVTSARLVADVR